MMSTSALNDICAHFGLSETDLLKDDPDGFPRQAAMARECLEVLELWGSIRCPDARRRCLNMLRSSASAGVGPGVTPQHF